MLVVVIDARIKWWNGETDCIFLCRNNIRYGWMLKENRGKRVKDGRESEFLFQTTVHGTHFSHRLNRNAWLFTIYIFQGLPTRSVELPLEQTHARTGIQTRVQCYMVIGTTSLVHSRCKMFSVLENYTIYVS